MGLGAILAGINILGGLFGKHRPPTQTTNTTTTSTVTRNNPQLQQLAGDIAPTVTDIRRQIINSIQGRLEGNIPKTGNVLTEEAQSQMLNLLSNPYQSSINTQTYGALKEALQRQYDLQRQEAERRLLDQMAKLGITRSTANTEAMGRIENQFLTSEQSQLANIDLQMMRDLENARLRERQIQQQEIGQAAGLGYQDVSVWNDTFYRAMNDAMNMYQIQLNALMGAYSANTTTTTTQTAQGGVSQSQPSGFEQFLNATAPIAGRWLEQKLFPPVQQPNYLAPFTQSYLMPMVIGGIF